MLLPIELIEVAALAVSLGALSTAALKPWVRNTVMKVMKPTSESRNAQEASLALR